MGKLLLSLSFLGISVLLLFGLFAPDSPVMWMASTSSGFAILRAVMLIALLALIATNPPRNIYLRGVVGLLAAGIAYWSLSATYQNKMLLLDTLALLQFSVSAGLTALERGYESAFHPVDPPSKKAHA